jgi:peptidoglycan/LPS O-acetylase OafA/YrhL
VDRLSTEAKETVPQRMEGSPATKPDAAQQKPNESRPEAHHRLPQLDGLRAVAVILVMASHAWDHAPWGWTGVHLFFALSGFLITGILRRARNDSAFWGPFYLKRATRILPPLVPFFLFWTLMGAVDWRGNGWAYLFFGANIVLSIPWAKITGLAVLWSLAVEEHFYMLWPFAIRWMQRRGLILLLVAVLVAEPVARAIASHYLYWLPIYFLTCFQLDGLAAGALLAVLVESDRWRAWLLRYAGWLTVATLAVLVACTFDPTFARDQNSTAFNSIGYSLVALVCVLWVAHAYLNPKALVSRALAYKPVLFIGTISYGLYLYNGGCGDLMDLLIPHGTWHQGMMGWIRMVLGVVLAVVVSWVSFRFYETPLVRWGRRKAGELAGPGHRGVDFMPQAPGSAKS